MAFDPLPNLPHLSTVFPPEVHAAHTSPRGVQYPIGMTPQKAASTLDKAGRHVKTDIRSGKTTGKGKGSRVSKKTGRAIVGSNYRTGGKR